LRERLKDRDTAIYGVLLIIALVWPLATIYATDSTFLVAQAGHAGTFVLLAIGLNVVVGFAGLLDLGYAAFFAIGAYTYALFASNQLASSPIHHQFHLPFWLMLFVAWWWPPSSARPGLPHPRLRGDYLAIVTLGFGEIVPQLFYNLDQWTGGINAIGNIDQPTLPSGSPDHGQEIRSSSWVPKFSFAYDPVAYYVLVVIMVIGAVILVTNSTAPDSAARGWHPRRRGRGRRHGNQHRDTKLLAFAIGASFSGFAGRTTAPASASSAPTRSCSWSPSRFW